MALADELSSFELDLDSGFWGDPKTRRKVVGDLLASSTMEKLLGNVRRAFSGFGVSSFTIYSSDAKSASLVFSAGVDNALDESTGGRIDLAAVPALREFLQSRAPFWSPGSEARGSIAGATVLFRLLHDDATIGFFVIYGLIPSSLLELPVLDEFLDLVTMFTALFQRTGQAELTNRANDRNLSMLNELMEGKDILLLEKESQIYESILVRGLSILGSPSGNLWLLESDDKSWRLAHIVGAPPTEGMAEVERLLQQCIERKRPAVVSSLSGEEIWDFDVDSIHMASITVFPLATMDKGIGCVVGFDSTVSQDMIDILGATLMVGAIAIENWRSREHALDRQRLAEQLAIAAQVQQRLLPQHRADLPELSIAHYSRYCDETGGDYVDFIGADDPKVISFVVADVSGHGLGSAMLMVDVRARIRTYVQDGDALRPDKILATVNRILCQESAAEQFATVVLATLDVRTGVFKYASAGHEPPLILRNGNWIELESTGLPIGMVEEAEYEANTILLEKDDILLFATDGATEAADRQGRQLGIGPLKDTVESLDSLEAQSVIDAVVQRTLNHCEQHALIDDLTFLAVCVRDLCLQILDKAPEMPGECVLKRQIKSSREHKDEYLAELIEVMLTQFSNHDLNGVFMAAEEAVTNAVVHGNREDTSQEAIIELWADGDQLALVTYNGGSGFDPFSRLPDFHDQETLLKESGRGIIMMVLLMDQVLYWDEGRACCMTKRFDAEDFSAMGFT